MTFPNDSSTASTVFKIIVGTLMFLSILCSGFLIITFLIFGDPKTRTYPIKLIMYLSVALIIGFLFFLIFDQPAIVLNEGACFFVGLMMHYGFLANFCWTFCIAFNFYRMIVAQDRDTQSYEKWYHLASWCTPLIGVIIIGALREYGRLRSRFVCWIKDPIAALVGFFIPGLLIVSANTILFFFVAREINDTLKGAADIRGGDKKDTKRQFRVYISIIFSIGLSWIFGFLMMLFIEEETRVIAAIFDVLFNIFTPLQGFFLFGSYCINEKIFKKWANLLGKCMPCFAQVGKHLEQMSTASMNTTSGSGSNSTSSN